MMCNNCVMHLEAMEDELKGIRQAKASLARHSLQVDFDEQMVDEAHIRQWIVAKGYSVE
jgi:copper chaperone CopZ